MDQISKHLRPETIKLLKENGKIFVTLDLPMVSWMGQQNTGNQCKNRQIGLSSKLKHQRTLSTE